MLVTALAALDGVELTVVAPAEQRSGTGSQSTDGPVETTVAKTSGGHEATASPAPRPMRCRSRSTSWASNPTSSSPASRGRTWARSNRNVPSCAGGQLRGMVEVVTDLTTTEGAPEPGDFTSAEDGFTDDITAFLNGFATLADVTAEPASA